jgi:resuscitation-promoting factor RpfB
VAAPDPAPDPAPVTRSVTYTHTAPTQHWVSSASSGGTAVAGSALEQCIISRESGGNPNAMNSSGHWGLYQFSRSTWVAYGGSASSFGSASAAAQQQVFNNAIAAGGASNWTPYDGC